MTHSVLVLSICFSTTVTAQAQFRSRKQSAPTPAKRVGNPGSDPQQTPRTVAATTRKQEADIRLAYYSAGWEKVLTNVSEQSGLGLVMDQVPPGTFTRR
ncbi:MAG: hypothetical protein ABGZ17_13930, partial [Planctomycetaceae bacterium]